MNNSEFFKIFSPVEDFISQETVLLKFHAKLLFGGVKNNSFFFRKINYTKSKKIELGPQGIQFLNGVSQKCLWPDLQLPYIKRPCYLKAVQDTKQVNCSQKGFITLS